MFKNRPGSFFTFFSKEHAGALVLLGIAVLLAILPRLILSQSEPVVLGFTRDSAEIASLIRQQQQFEDSVRKSRYSKRNLKYTSEKDLLSLGIDKSTAKVILGRIRSGELSSVQELARITGKDSTDLSRLYYRETEPIKPTAVYSPSHPLEINSADSAEILLLQGIGPKYAHRILAYRQLLGGFYSKAQLMELRSVDSTAIRNILPVIHTDPQLVRKMAISAAGQSLLEAHPYLNRKQAALLVAFKSQHGKLTRADFLSHPAFTAETKNRLLPYLEFDN